MIVSAPLPATQPGALAIEAVLAAPIASRIEQRLPLSNSSVVVVTLIVAAAAGDASTSSAKPASTPKRVLITYTPPPGRVSEAETRPHSENRADAKSAPARAWRGAARSARS